MDFDIGLFKSVLKELKRRFSKLSSYFINSDNSSPFII